MLTLALTLSACGIAKEPAALLARIVRVESNGVPFALNVNGGLALARQPGSEKEAVATAQWLLRRGKSFDAGLAQVNSKNFDRLGLTVESAFEPCANLRAAEQVLLEGRSRATARFGPGTRALDAALSCYNTGDLRRGALNGYVASVRAIPRAEIGEREGPKRERGTGRPSEGSDVFASGAPDAFQGAAK